MYVQLWMCRRIGAVWSPDQKFWANCFCITAAKCWPTAGICRPRQRRAFRFNCASRVCILYYRVKCTVQSTRCSTGVRVRTTTTDYGAQNLEVGVTAHDIQTRGSTTHNWSSPVLRVNRTIHITPQNARIQGFKPKSILFIFHIPTTFLIQEYKHWYNGIMYLRSTEMNVSIVLRPGLHRGRTGTVLLPGRVCQLLVGGVRCTCARAPIIKSGHFIDTQ